MQLVFTEEQQELRRAARAFLSDHSDSEQVRAAMASELGFDAETWQRIATELGWTGVAIPEQYGGAGLGFVELMALLEEMGEALLCAPFLSTVCMAAPALLASGDCAATREWLPAIAEGRAIATLAITEANGRFGANGIAALARPSGDGFVLEGEKRFVLDGHGADLLLIAARREGSTGADGISLFAVPAVSPGIERRALPTMDQTRRLADVSLRGVRVSAAALVGEAGQGWSALSHVLDLAAIALGAEQVGGAQRCLDLAVAYAKERVQFGRAIGSFQAIKHKCADMMTAVESSRSAAYYAACVANEGGAELSRVASLTKAWCSEAYFRCAADALQIHGGVGFTWEYDVHLHLKRARSMEAFLGSPTWHRERVATEIGL
jgi:alkylation response protein AidB-like acyl-CoA dehydrogenase